MKTIRPETRHTRRKGFTLVEAIVAVSILGMVAFMMFRSLLSVLDATKLGTEAADHVQRERVAIKTVEDGLRGMVYYEQNQSMYALTVNPDPDMLSVSFVSRVPPDYIGSREFSGQTLRRLAFSVEYINDKRALILEQSHVMRAPDGEEAMPVVRSVLAPDLAEFIIHFWSTSAEDWIDEWTETNSLPSRVKVEMALTRMDGGLIQLSNVLKREVVIHSVSITKNNQNPAVPAAAKSSRGGGRGRGGSSSHSSSQSRSQGSRYTPEQIAAYRKRMAERNQGKTDGGSRYTDAQREAYRKRMAEMYKRGQSQGSGAVNFVPPAGGQQGDGQQSGNQASNAPSASSGTPGAIAINNALMDYEGLNGQPATSIQQLLDEKYLSEIPDPPDGMEWVINSQGNVTYIPL